MKRLLARALNKNQLLILSKIAGHNSSISSLLNSISQEQGVPLSSLKLNSRILKELGLIHVSIAPENYGEVRLSNDGEAIVSIINDA